MWDAAREAWPGIDVGQKEFAAYVLERRVASGAANDDPASEGTGPVAPLTLHGSDLYLACACVLRDPAALAAFEKKYFPEIDAAVKRIGGLSTEDVVQILRAKLFVAEEGARPKIAEYSGRGALRGWVRITTTRTALNAIKSGGQGAREVPFEDSALTFLVGSGDDPELTYLKRHYSDEFRTSFGEAFRGLESRDRTLLRYAFGEGLPVDGIGAIYGVHRATAARWVAKAHSTLNTRVRKEMVERLRVSEQELTSILRLIDSQLHITLDRYLKKTENA